MIKTLVSIDDVRKALDGIKQKRKDYEYAHMREDEMYVGVLRAIANNKVYGCTPAELAQEALRARRIKFPRHHA